MVKSSFQPGYTRNEMRKLVQKKMHPGDSVYIPKDISHNDPKKAEHAVVVRLSKNVVVFRLSEGGFLTSYELVDCLGMNVDREYKNSAKFIRDFFRDVKE